MNFARCVIVCVTAFVGLSALHLPSVVLAESERDFAAAWQDAESFDQRTRDRVFRDAVDPQWLGPDDRWFWYRVRTGQDTHQFVLVDAEAGTRKPAFDHQQLATALQQQPQLPDAGITADQLPLQALQFSDDVGQCSFRVQGHDWTFTLPAGPLQPAAAAGEPTTAGLPARQRVARSRDGGRSITIRFENRLDQPLTCFWVTPDGQLRPYGSVEPGGSRDQHTFGGHAWVLRDATGNDRAAFVADESELTAVIDPQTPIPQPWQPRRPPSVDNHVSPDKRWRIDFRDHNVVVIDVESGQQVAVSSDGSADEIYGGRVWWSPDSSRVVVMKTAPGLHRTIPLVDAAPDESHHPKLMSIDYAKPGDPLDRPRPVLLSADSQWEPLVIDNALFDNPFSIGDLQWNTAGDSFSFVYNQRGHQVLRVIAVDAGSGSARTVIDETSDTFVCYSQKQFLHRSQVDDQWIWMSERSGWNHLYLIDAVDGSIINPITAGSWVVREVERVDQDARQLWLKVSGIDPEQDPYHTHLIRVDWDGQNLVRLTAGDGDHRWQFSPDRRYLIDTYSRVDLPPVSVLRDADNGQQICELEQAEISELIATGWQLPQRFVAKARDGETDIHGIIVRPTHFDPDKRYPVLEDIYAGPHSSFVPKSFGRHTGMFAMAELGFIVVKIDGMGTSNRSKAFHDVCWQNLHDSGFPDRVAWITAAAAQHREMDLSRVGIWGGSAGGQSAMRALIDHGDFYHAAVADCGCHDNRVDKIWWNEQWMGWPLGPHYEAASNVTQAHRLQGDLMLIWGELDRNVDPASSMQVVDALVRADKDFEMLVIPGQGHGAAGHPYAKRRQAEFLFRKLKVNGGW